MSEQQKKAPQEVRNVADFLRSGKAGLKTRVGLWNGKRVDYFKGKSAIKALMSPAFAKLKNVPRVTTEEEATALLTSMIPYAFFLLVQRGNPSAGAKSPKHLQVNSVQSFQPDGYFAWFYEGSQLMTYVGGAGMVLFILAGVMFPLWPPIMRLGAWYVSLAAMGFLALFFAIALVRLVLYVISLVTSPPGIWIFPKLFADVGFVESFIPLWEWDLPKKKTKKRKSKDDDSEKSGKSKGNGGESNGVAVTTQAATDATATATATATAPGPTAPRQRSAFIEEVEDDGS